MSIFTTSGSDAENEPPVAVKRDKPKTPEQCALIALAEYEYWRTQERVDENIAAMAAAANIYAAITMGMMAPWHPK